MIKVNKKLQLNKYIEENKIPKELLVSITGGAPAKTKVIEGTTETSATSWFGYICGEIYDVFSALGNFLADICIGISDFILVSIGLDPYGMTPEKMKKELTAKKIASERSIIEKQKIAWQKALNFYDRDDKLNTTRYNKVQELIRQGYDVNIEYSGNETPLYKAAELGNDKLVRLLLDNGANIGGNSKMQSTPLEKAVGVAIGRVTSPAVLLDMKKRTEGEDKRYGKVIELLTERGAKIRDLYVEKNTMLHIAVQLDIAILALNQRNGVNKQNKYGDTPVHIAARYGLVEMTEILIQTTLYMSDIKNNNKRTPLSEVVELENRHEDERLADCRRIYEKGNLTPEEKEDEVKRIVKENIDDESPRKVAYLLMSAYSPANPYIKMWDDVRVIDNCKGKLMRQVLNRGDEFGAIDAQFARNKYTFRYRSQSI